MLIIFIRDVQFNFYDLTFFSLHALHGVSRYVYVFFCRIVYSMDVMMENDILIICLLLTRMSFFYWVTCVDNNIIKIDYAAVHMVVCMSERRQSIQSNFI